MAPPNGTTVELWVTSTNTNTVTNTKAHGPGGFDPFDQPAPLSRISASADALLKKIDEVSDFLANAAAHLKETRVRLDEVTVSFELSSQGAIQWVLGAGAKGGASLKFKIDPPHPKPELERPR